MKSPGRSLEPRGILSKRGAVNALARVVAVVIMARLTLAASTALRRVRFLETILPICSHCRRIRDEREERTTIERYFAARSDARFSHGVCPECARREYAEFIER